MQSIPSSKCRIIYAPSHLLAHNHPCGNLEPSIEDNEVTKKLR
ncbi:JAB domain-containing protein [Sphaerochaeta sp.]